ncbi:MAG TPA: Hpt domain-containing protein, partial [Lysobacter sp.]
IPMYLKRLSEELTRASIETHRANEAKSRFVAGIVRDFGAPLERLADRVEDLRKTSLDAAQRDRLEAIRGTTRALRALVDEVVDIATPEAVTGEWARAKAGGDRAVLEPRGRQSPCDARGASSGDPGGTGDAAHPIPAQAPATAPRSGAHAATNIIAFGNPFLRHRSRVRSLHVLIAERDATQRATLQRLLHKAGHRVTCVDEHDDVAGVLAATRFDLVIADVVAAAAFEGGRDAATARTPLLVLADAPGSKSLPTGEGAAVWRVLGRPVSTTPLLDALAEIGHRGRHGDAPRTESAKRVEDIEFDSAVLDELASIGMGEAFEREFIAECLADAGRSLGLLAESASRSDWMQVREHANAIGGVAGNVGLTKLSRLAGELRRAPDWQLAGEWRVRVAVLRDRLADGRRVLDARLARHGLDDPASRSD